jgi:hypothetical protein
MNQLCKRKLYRVPHRVVMGARDPLPPQPGPFRLGAGSGRRRRGHRHRAGRRISIGGDDGACRVRVRGAAALRGIHHRCT